MTEAEARSWLCVRFDAGAVALCDRYVELLRAESKVQNLVSIKSLETVWTRHIVDSAQLVALAAPLGLWVDIGSGAGLPGLVVAMLCDRPVVLIEPRRRRVEFLQTVVSSLDIRNVVIFDKPAALVDVSASVISARAVASLRAVFDLSYHMAAPGTRWLLPKGRNLDGQLAEVGTMWDGVFHVKQSVTDSSSRIVIADGVRRR